MLCPDTDDVLGFLDGRCTAPDAERFEDHVDGCADCRALIAALGQVGVHDPGTDAAPEQCAVHAAAPGSRLGRYIVIDDLGEGAMGRVLRAHDPELGRDVALKLVRVHGDARAGARAQQRLVREAQAMARLAHPNVVAVHDTGTFGGDVFVAMELVEGCDLATWLRRARRPWTEVAGVFVQAGRGLAAAHAAGIVHRDFKPANVLVGDDGRVRVTDFGLAAVVGAVDDLVDLADRSAESSGPSPRLTATGTVMGTPAYMSPEARRGVAIGEASDQYSFCVALCEALAGCRPDGAEAAREAELPRRIRAVVARGLARRPEDRFGSMSALVEALARARAPRAAQRIAAAVAVVAIGAAGAGYAGARDAPAAVCPAPRDRVAAVWGKVRKQAARRAFDASGAPAARRIWHRVDSALDTHATAWVEGHVQACEATRVRHAQSDELLDRRMACLDGELDRLDAVAALVAGADADTVKTAVAAVESLSGRLSRCADTAGLRDGQPLPAAPAARKVIEDLTTELAQLELLNVRGRYREAIERGRRLVERAETAGSLKLVASARVALGNGLWRADQLVDAEAQVHRAIEAARQARAWDVEADALVVLVGVLSEDRYAEALQVARLAEAAIEARGDDVMLARLLGNRGAIHWMKGDIDAAEPDFTRSLELMSAALDPDDRRVGMALENLAMVRHMRGDHAAALADYDRARAIFENIYGPRHPELALISSNRALTLVKLDRIGDARRALADALAIRRDLLGADHREVAITFEEIGEIDLLVHDYRAALARFDEAHAILSAALAADHPELAVALGGRGRALLGLGRAADAVAPLERALELSQLHGVDQLAVGELRFALARALWQAGGDRARARRLAIDARDGERNDPETRAQAARWLKEHR